MQILFSSVKISKGIPVRVPLLLLASPPLNDQASRVMTEMIMIIMTHDLLIISPQPRDLSGGQAEVATQLVLPLPQPLDLALGRHVLSEQLQLVHLEPRHLLDRNKITFCYECDRSPVAGCPTVS